MSIPERLLIPYLAANVCSKAPVEFEQLVPLIEHALGVRFASDTEGLYEELQALVSQPLGYTLAVYRGDRLEVEENPTRDIRIVVDLSSWIDISTLAIPDDAIDDPTVWLSDYLAHLLTTRTGYVFQATQSADTGIGLPSIHVPLLTASIQATTVQSPATYLTSICQCLGIPEKRLDTASGSQLEMQRYTTEVLGHELLIVSAETASEHSRLVSVQLTPGAETSALVQNMATPIYLPIDAFLARLVSEATGLPFAASTSR